MQLVAFDGRVVVGQAGLAQSGGRGQIGHQRGIAAAAALDDASAAGEDHGLGNAEALAHAVQALGLMAQRQAVEIGDGQPSCCGLYGFLVGTTWLSSSHCQS